MTCATHHKVRKGQVVCAGVRFPGLIHPGLIGTAPSQELLDIWNEREGKLVEDGDKAITLGGVLHTRPLGMLPSRVPTHELVGRDCNLTAITLYVVVSRVLALPLWCCLSFHTQLVYLLWNLALCVIHAYAWGSPLLCDSQQQATSGCTAWLQQSSSHCISRLFTRESKAPWYTTQQLSKTHSVENYRNAKQYIKHIFLLTAVV